MLIVLSSFVYSGGYKITNADWGEYAWNNATPVHTNSLAVGGWTELATTGTYDNTLVHNGTLSLRIAGDGGTYSIVPPASSNYTRFWHYDIDDGSYVRVKTGGDWVYFNFNGVGATVDCFTGSAAWHLLELHINISGVSLYRDGTFCDQEAVTDQNFTLIGFSSSSNAITFDDFEVGTYDNVSAAAPPVAETGINITIINPSNGAGFNSANLTGNVTINGMFNSSSATVVSVNDTRFTVFYPDGVYNFSIHNNTEFTSTDVVRLLIYANQTGTTNGTASIYFTIDFIFPLIDPDYRLPINKTYVYNGTLSTQINFTDDNEIYSINVSFCNGTEIETASNVGSNTYSVDIHRPVDPSPLGCLYAQVCDSHTGTNIKEIENKYQDDGVLFEFSKKFFIFTDDYIKIYPKQKISNVEPYTYKENDRYIFELPRSDTYIIESSHFIDIPKKQLYAGHLVIPGIGPGYWVDLETDDATDHKIRRISPNKIEVDILGLKDDIIKFNSIGVLNCNETNYYYNNLNPIQTQDNTVITNQTTNINLSLTTVPTFTSVINSTLYYDNAPYYGNDNYNYSLSVTTPSVGPYYAGVNYTWVLNISGIYYNLTNQTQDVHNVYIDNCSNISYFRSTEVYFRNIETLDLINTNFTLTLSGDKDYYTTGNNTQQFALCIYPSFINLSELFSMQYEALATTGYYNLNINLSNTTLSTVTIYIQAGASSTTFTIKDQDTSRVLPDVFISMYRLVGPDYVLVQSKYSDITGRIKFTYVDDVKYKFLLTKNSYQSYLFYLDPILFSSYDILLTKDLSYNVSQDYDQLALYYTPTLFYNEKVNNFTFMIHSPYDALTGYGYTLTFPGGTDTQAGTSTAGESLESGFTITGATVQDRLKLDYYYITDQSGQRNFTFYYSIVVGNYTMVSNIDRTYGLGLFERVFLSVFIVILVVGVSTLIGQPIGGMGLGLLVMGYLTFIGFLPLWAILLPVTIGLIILGSRPEG